MITFCRGFCNTEVGTGQPPDLCRSVGYREPSDYGGNKSRQRWYRPVSDLVRGELMCSHVSSTAGFYHRDVSDGWRRLWVGSRQIIQVFGDKKGSLPLQGMRLISLLVAKLCTMLTRWHEALHVPRGSRGDHSQSKWSIHTFWTTGWPCQRTSILGQPSQFTDNFQGAV